MMILLSDFFVLDEILYNNQCGLNHLSLLFSSMSFLQYGPSFGSEPQPDSDTEGLSEVYGPPTQEGVEETPLPAGVLGFLHPGQPPPVPCRSWPARYDYTPGGSSKLSVLCRTGSLPYADPMFINL